MFGYRFKDMLWSILWKTQQYLTKQIKQQSDCSSTQQLFQLQVKVLKFQLWYFEGNTLI